MKVILLQTDICWADPAANVAYMDKLISAHAQDTDLFVLPEMFPPDFVLRRKVLPNHLIVLPFSG